MKNKIKKIVLSVVTFSMICLPFTDGFTSIKAASNVMVNLASKKQVIRGFGGMNSVAWAGDLTAAQRETAFGNGNNQLGLSVVRIFVDDNKNNWYKELPTAKSAIAHGSIVFATPWNPPSSMTETFNRNGEKAKRLRYDKYGDYAKYLNDFVSYMKNNGVNLYAISVQNEPDYGRDWTWWTPQEVLRFMRDYAGSINCRVMSPESFSYQKNMYDPILNDPKALANMDILGTHTYGTQVKDFPYPLFKQKAAGKDLWMTEVYVPNSDANSADRWPEALEVANHINNAMVEGDFQAYVWWYIRRSYGLIKENGAISKRGYMMAHFSKFVRPGYVRVDATKNPVGNVYVSAYTGNNKVVIVAINKGTYPVNQSFNIQNSTVSNVSSWVTSGTLNMAKTNSNINAANGRFNASLPAQSVTTFVADLNSTKPTTNPTTNPTPGSTVTLNNGWYYIKNINAQKYLQVANNTGKAGQNVELGSGSGVAGQKWYLTNTGDGYITLKNALGNYMLDVSYGENKDGSNIQIFNAYSGDSQKFAVKASSKNGQYSVATK
ncbi:RICIN domain-containing protein, partial [Clostridium acetobutylicum]